MNTLDKLKEILINQDLVDNIKFMVVIGSHEFKERTFFEETLPNLCKVWIFEPLPNIALRLRQEMASDPRYTIFECALHNYTGMADFCLMGPKIGYSYSALTPIHEGNSINPSISVVNTIPVQVCQLQDILPKNEIPDLMYMDCHGSEGPILQDLPLEILTNIKVISAECSVLEFFKGGMRLTDINDYLRPYFNFIRWDEEEGWCRIGDAVWVNKNHVKGETRNG